MGPNVSETGAGGDKPRIGRRKSLLILIAVPEPVISQESGRDSKLPTRIRIHLSTRYRPFNFGNFGFFQ